MPRRQITLLLLACMMLTIADKAMVKHQALRPRQFLGLVIAFLLIGFLAEVSGSLARAFAVLVTVSLFLTRGPRVFAAVSKEVK